MNEFGIKESDFNFLINTFRKYEHINKVIIFGSRAKGNFNDRSDIDLVIQKSNISRQFIGRIISEINESNFPFTVDLQIYEKLKNEMLISHINRVGKVIYTKDWV